jgi:hypothetical protein
MGTPVKILSYKSAPSGAGNTLALIDVEIVEGVRLYGLRLTQMPDGTHRVFGERLGLSRDVVVAIASAALSFEGGHLNASAS